MIINAAVHPILEYQADPHSFAYRPSRFAIDAIALVVQYLKHFQKQKGSFTYLQLKVSKSIDNMFREQKVKAKLRASASSQFCINVNIHRCFDDINHDTILKIYPLCNKYRYFLNTWLKARVYGLFFAESKNPIK